MLKNSLIFVSGMVTGAAALAGGVALYISRSAKKKQISWNEKVAEARAVVEDQQPPVYEPF